MACSRTIESHKLEGLSFLEGRTYFFFPSQKQFNLFKIQDVPEGHDKDSLQEQGELTDEENPVFF